MAIKEYFFSKIISAKTVTFTEYGVQDYYVLFEFWSWCSKVKVKVSGFCLIQRTLNTHLLPVLLKRVQLNEKSLLFVYQCATLSQEYKSVLWWNSYSGTSIRQRAKGLAKFVCYWYNNVWLYQGSFPYILLVKKIARYTKDRFIIARFHCTGAKGNGF